MAWLWYEERKFGICKNGLEKIVEGRRGRGRPKKWLDAIRCDMRTIGVCVDDVGFRVKWRFRTQVADSK